MESEIKLCGEEIELFKSVSKKSKKWYRDYGFEEIDNANTMAGKWAAASHRYARAVVYL